MLGVEPVWAALAIQIFYSIEVWGERGSLPGWGDLVIQSLDNGLATEVQDLLSYLHFRLNLSVSCVGFEWSAIHAATRIFS